MRCISLQLFVLILLMFSGATSTLADTTSYHFAIIDQSVANKDGLSGVVTLEQADSVLLANSVTAVQMDDGLLPVTLPLDEPALDPLNADYTIEGEQVRLKQGRAETIIVPGSAVHARTLVFGEPVNGDLDRDGDEDVALILVNSTGGSGSFYYIAVAGNTQGSYLGSNAVLLGDRIGLRDIKIRNGLLVVRYVERQEGEPMTAIPTLARTVVLQMNKGRLSEQARLGEMEQLLEGWVRIGHEVRTFTPCGQKIEYWLQGASPALGEITAAYYQTFPDAQRYKPLFMVLAGHISESSPDGLGADYSGVFVAKRLIRILSEGGCPEESISGEFRVE